MGPYPRDDVDETAAAPETRAERRDRATADTRATILAAARTTLLSVGYANLSTRAVADAAEVPLSQIHYHFGSKQQLILAVLEGENARLLAGGGGDVQIHQQDARIALAALADAGVRFDVVYLDPPYASPLYEPLLEESGRLLEETGTVVAEHFHKRALPETIGRLARTRSVRVGDHRLTFYREQESAIER